MSGRIRLGIDVRAALRGPCGITRYSLELARALLAADERVELLLYAASRALPGRAAAMLPADLVAHPRARLFAPFLPAKIVNALSHVRGFRTELLTGALQLFHHTNLVYVKGWRCAEVATIHDLAFEESRAFHDADFHDWAVDRVKAALARAKAIVVPSEATRADLIARWKEDPARIHVVPLGADHVLRIEREERRDPRPERARPYFVAVGTLEPRKNFARLLRAWRAARRAGLDADLVHVGPRGWLMEEFDAEVQRGGDDGRFVARGAVSDGELRSWIEGSLALCYPSLYEGFGLPVAEAFALGVPVVTSSRSSTREIAGDAAELIDPLNEEAIAQALLRLAGDARRREDLSSRGRARAASFTWARAAAATLAVDRATGAID